jgi:sulfite reductase alpha subunit-like flavoprotein
VIDLAETNFNEELVEGKVGIFLVATHGEGEPTDNAKAYMNWLAEVFI